MKELYYLSVYRGQYQRRHLENRLSSIYPFHIGSVLGKESLNRYLTYAALMFISLKTLVLAILVLPRYDIISLDWKNRMQENLICFRHANQKFNHSFFHVE